MIRVFVLEDDPIRIKVFKENFEKFAKFTFSTNIYDAMKDFDLNNKYDLILLDHDLGGETFVDSEFYNTGAQFCRYLIKKKIELPQIIIHSHNPVGAEIMEEYLIEKGYNASRVPFGELIKRWDQGTLSFFGHHKYDC
jgi:hypothetical protein